MKSGKAPLTNLDTDKNFYVIIYQDSSMPSNTMFINKMHKNFAVIDFKDPAPILS